MESSVGGGGAFNAPPLKSSRMKIKRHVRGQNRGSWVCPVHLDYFQLADMCISLVFTWFYAQNLSNCQAPGTGQVQIQVMPLSSFMSRFKSTTNSKLKFQSHNLKSGTWRDTIIKCLGDDKTRHH